MREELYRRLLIKYMMIVIGEEGIDFLGAPPHAPVDLTSDEWVLLRLAAGEAKEAMKESTRNQSHLI